MIGPHYLFVYGTLLQDINNEMSRFLANHSQFVSNGYFNGKLYEVNQYPGAILSDSTTGKVYGSLFKITNSHRVFEVLDVYEGVAEGLFKRAIINTFLPNKTVLSWVYLYNQPTTHLQIITSGDYLNKGDDN
ncbi:gamma-glutamylcyclotransferase [Sabulilitoribacter multivorans]|uniref:Gamma-glutamylcyclotransferase n=1 Tax=Flaviramulus multivorans TaxID=1304750 RepID=A0ABS9IHY5_9FLAO|nr:gamma-glutamylcyclotransferase family protein [Flaviramulus multivorans]MCF7560151.1 gamma-glutamylcyclotransferase [Flaviramulus multivorans]